MRRADRAGQAAKNCGFGKARLNVWREAGFGGSAEMAVMRPSVSAAPKRPPSGARQAFQEAEKGDRPEGNAAADRSQEAEGSFRQDDGGQAGAQKIDAIMLHRCMWPRSRRRAQSRALCVGCAVPYNYGRVVAKHLELATEMMRADAGLHTDQARRQVGEPRFHLAA